MADLKPRLLPPSRVLCTPDFLNLPDRCVVPLHQVPWMESARVIARSDSIQHPLANQLLSCSKYFSLLLRIRPLGIQHAALEFKKNPPLAAQNPNLPTWAVEAKCWVSQTRLFPLRKMPCLTTLDVSSNQLTSLPESLGNITSLALLVLQYNPISRMPDCVFRLRSLH